MNLSDQILAIAKNMSPFDGAGLRMIAVQVRRMEEALDELVSEAMEEALAPVVIHFPPHSRMRP
jgi:hypothetical protein